MLNIRTYKVGYILVFMLFIIMVWCGGMKNSWADMYRYIDKDGNIHFTNVPTDPKYNLFLKTDKSRYFNNHNFFQYDHFIKKAALKYGIDKALIKAIIMAESDFNPTVVSKKGAKGLMQLMPMTAADMNVKNVFDPKENVMGGVKYLRYLLNTFNDTVLAVAAYNAGPIAVKKYGTVPPYTETVNYVKKVFRFYDEIKSPNSY